MSSSLSDLNDFVSDTSEGSADLHEESASRGRPKKRKTEGNTSSSRSRLKRLKSHYDERYRGLFNETLEDILCGDRPDEISVAPSQINATFWSCDEKEQFFLGLARRGRQDIQGLAADISSKSESEVNSFLQKLEEAASKEQSHEVAPKKLVRTSDIDAAVEISEDCCLSLDAAAEALSLLQQREEERVEKKQYKEHSLLTPRLGQWVERHLGAGDVAEDEIANKLPAAVLLDLKTFLILSKRFFMNSRDKEMNWRSYAERRKPPSIMFTAFSDLHNLVFSVTKRIVQSSLSLATSRIRALDASSSYRSRRYVKRLDVLAALDVLGMERNSKQLWAGVARKCKLRVYDKVRHRKVAGKRYSYNEVEERLIPEQIKKPEDSGPEPTLTSNDSVSEHINSLETCASKNSSHSISSTSGSTEGSNSGSLLGDDDFPYIHDDERSRTRELLESARDTYMEALDHQASQGEERRLWELLGEDPDGRTALQAIQLPGVPATVREDRADLIDRRTWVNYASEWEEFESPVNKRHFAGNRRRKGKLDLDTSLTDSDTGSGELDEQSSQIQGFSKEILISDESVASECSSEAQAIGCQDSIEGSGNDVSKAFLSESGAEGGDSKGSVSAADVDKKVHERELSPDGNSRAHGQSDHDSSGQNDENERQ